MDHASACITRYLNLVGGLLVAMFVFTQAAQAQAPAPGKHDAVYMYRGADRDARLLEKARQEGTLTWYTSMASKESMPLSKAFEKKYGIKVELWRAPSDKVLQRALTEGQAQRYIFDVVETNGTEVEQLGREKLLSEYFSPHFADLPPMVFAPSRLWVSDRVNFFVVAYNTDKVKRDELPKHYEGFLAPKWKGQIGIEASDSEWMATIVKKLGAERGTALFDKLSAMRPDVRKSHILLAEMVGAGEVPVALTVYNSEVESLKRRDGPIDWVPVEPVVARPIGLGLSRNAPHPHAALLFADYVLSPEGQELLNSMGRVPVSLKVKTALNNLPYTMMDSGMASDENEKWLALWNKLFLVK